MVSANDGNLANRKKRGLLMMRLRLVLFMLATFCAAPLTALAANTGTITYATGNCFVIRTANGVALFERSGGGLGKLDQKVKGVLDDFGYQQLRDVSGKDLMVGFVQEYGVKKEDKISAFKKSCR